MPTICGAGMAQRLERFPTGAREQQRSFLNAPDPCILREFSPVLQFSFLQKKYSNSISIQRSAGLGVVKLQSVLPGNFREFQRLIANFSGHGAPVAIQRFVVG